MAEASPIRNTNNGDVHISQEVMDDPVRRQCNEILLWRRGNGGRKPMQTRECCEEGRLAVQQAKLTARVKV